MNSWEKISQVEERIRDTIFGPIVKLTPKWLMPNHITSLRAILVALAIVLFLMGYPLTTQIWILTIAALTDTFDGVLARVRDQKSQFGAYIDHTCDWLLGFWTGLLALIHGLLPINFIVLIVTMEAGIIILDRIMASRIKEINKKKPGKRILAIIMGPANFKPSTFARIQFTFILFGFYVLLFSNALNYTNLRTLGLASLYSAVCLGAVVFIESYTRLKTGVEQ
jgi:CDP-diacylglycerol--glycerol-3-phosphate 3-phosphatidyltransferase